MDIAIFQETVFSSTKSADALVPVKEFLSVSQHSNDFLKVVTECADASRDEEWREPLGDSGVLDLVANLLDVETMRGEGARAELQIQMLRLCGNSCADTDNNRERMAKRPDGLKSFISAAINDKLLKFGIPVLYNILVDYENTQKQAINEGIVEALCTLLGRENNLHNEGEGNVLGEDLVDHIVKIMELLVNHDEFKNSVDPSSISVLLKLILSPHLTDLDIYASLLQIITVLLSYASFQAHVINTSTVDVLLNVLQDSYSRFLDEEEEQESARKILTQLRKALIISLSDVSSNPEFTQRYPLDSSPLLKKLHGWLSTSTASTENQTDYLLAEALQTSACIMLGNVATSDTACLSLVNSHSIHIPLIAIMGQSDKDHGTVFSSVGMLRNLVLPTENKLVIGDPESGIWQALETRWLHGIEGGVEKQVPYAVSGFGRILVKGCRENALRMLENATSCLPGDGEASEKITTRLSLLLKLSAKSDEVPTQTEIARTVCEVLRCIAAWKGQASGWAARENGIGLTLVEMEERVYNSGGKYHNHGMIPQVIGAMVKQDKWPAVRSEGIFALGLLAAGFGGGGQGVGFEGHSFPNEGARLAWSVKGDWWGLISGEREKVKLEGKDSANALVLVAEVRSKLDGDLLPEEKGKLDELVRKLASNG